MNIDPYELGEDSSLDVLRWSSLDGDDQPDSGVVLIGCDADVALADASDLPRVRGKFVPGGGDDGKDLVLARRGLDLPRLMFTLGHESFHLWCHRTGQKLGRAEDVVANIHAAALLMPRRGIVRAFRRRESIIAVAEGSYSHVPATAVALRLGEVREVPVWIVECNAIRSRRTNWRLAKHQSEAIVALANETFGARTYVERAGLVAERLPDAERRAVVYAAQTTWWR